MPAACLSNIKVKLLGVFLKFQNFFNTWRHLLFRQLHLFLSMFMHRDEDGKSQISKDQEKESIAAINSIFHSVKQSEDAVDATKSKVGKCPFFNHFRSCK